MIKHWIVNGEATVTTQGRLKIKCGIPMLNKGGTAVPREWIALGCMDMETGIVIRNGQGSLEHRKPKWLTDPLLRALKVQEFLKQERKEKRKKSK